MAPKRPAPPPPVDSSEETGSGSGSDDSEEEITHSPPSAAPKNTAPPPQEVQRPEASDEDEEEEEGEGEEEEEEEEEEGKVNQATPSSTTKNPPPPPNREESESDEGEEEDTDDEALQSKSAPKQEAEGKGGKQPSSSEDKKPAGPFQRVWSMDDNVRILEALAAHRREHGKLPQPDELEIALAGGLHKSEYGRKELLGKVKNLKATYTRTANKGNLPSKDSDRRIYDLSKEVWGSSDKPANGIAPRDFGEMCALYPNLAEEMKGIEKTHLGLFKREFGMISDEKALAVDTKVTKQRQIQMKVELRHCDINKEVIKLLTDLARVDLAEHYLHAR